MGSAIPIQCGEDQGPQGHRTGAIATTQSGSRGTVIGGLRLWRDSVANQNLSFVSLHHHELPDKSQGQLQLSPDGRGHHQHSCSLHDSHAKFESTPQTLASTTVVNCGIRDLP